MSESNLPGTIERQMAELADLDTRRLHEELLRSLRVTAEQLVRLAAIVRMLEERGEDLSEIKIGMLGMVRLIAYGQLLPDVVVQLQGSPMVLNRVAALPLPDQRRLIDSGSVEVVELEEAGPTMRKVGLLRLGRDEVFQVFARDHVRDAGEQRSFLKNRKPRRRSKVVDEHGVVLDAKRGGIRVGELFLSRADLARYLTRLEEQRK